MSVGRPLNIASSVSRMKIIQIINRYFLQIGIPKFLENIRYFYMLRICVSPEVSPRFYTYFTCFFFGHKQTIEIQIDIKFAYHSDIYGLWEQFGIFQISLTRDSLIYLCKLVQMSKCPCQENNGGIVPNWVKLDARFFCAIWCGFVGAQIVYRFLFATKSHQNRGTYASIAQKRARRIRSNSARFGTIPPFLLTLGIFFL